MEIDPQKLSALLDRLEILTRQQNNLQNELSNLKKEINDIQTGNVSEQQKSTPELNEQPLNLDYQTGTAPEIPSEEPVQAAIPETARQKTKLNKANLEEFIGGNLINKIGIIITVIGVAIGTKYAIDHDLISPLTRIILGYVFGLGLMLFAIRLKKNYGNFSAVLLSGAMAINYFVTYAAYSFYAILPQALAFVIMVMFTIFTVIAALNYKMQVIAVIGLVGAYAVPFLLSDGSGKVLILFTYMTIINAGILAVAIKRHWKPLYISAFGFTWLIYLTWFSNKYDWTVHQETALLFAAIFFLIFYAAFVTNKIIMKEKFDQADIVLVISNSFVFYGIGYSIIDSGINGNDYLGLFTLVNALLHSVVSFIVYKDKLADRNIFYLVSGLVLLFITITIPVQLNGGWITLLWAGESVILYRIGRSRNISFYEKLSLPLMFAAFISLIHNWSTGYFNYNYLNDSGKLTPVLNVVFLTSVLFTALFVLNYFSSQKGTAPVEKKKLDLPKITRISVAVILFVVSYLAGILEILNYFEQKFIDTSIEVTKEYTYFVYNYDWRSFGTVWAVNYTLVYLAAFLILNDLKIRKKFLYNLNLILNFTGMFIFLTAGLYALSSLRDSYLGSVSEYFERSIFNIIIRYITLLPAIALLSLSYVKLKHVFDKKSLNTSLDAFLHISIIWILSSELLNWMHISGSGNSYKLALSILWGVYSLFLIIIGIRKSSRQLRIGAIILFSVTLLKLFFYDIAHLDTISKTIVFVSLGILLLTISFLYNKYKNVINNEQNN